MIRPAVAVLHDSVAVRTTLRRGLRSRGLRLVVCRGPQHLTRVLARQLIDAIVISVRGGREANATTLARDYPGIPVYAAGPFRPDDGRLLLACRRAGVRNILVDGVDDQAAAELVASAGASRRLRAALRSAPGLLRLSEPLQLRAWEQVLVTVGSATTTAHVARALNVSREHLSREFAAGGAPNIKRVIDLARVLVAADLLRNPGYSVTSVARVLAFSSASHFAGCVRRVAGVPPLELRRLGMNGVLIRFVRGRMRSRL